MTRRHAIATAALSAPAFAVGGAVSRYTLRTTETRWQIAAFVALAAGAEMILQGSGRNRSSFLRGSLNAVAATAVIVSVKFHLEPAARKHGSAVVRHLAKTVVKGVVDRR